jgi:hypothetical protein
LQQVHADDYDDDDVDVVRRSLWTAATNGHMFIPKVTYAMENHGGMISTKEKTDSSARAVW